VRRSWRLRNWRLRTKLAAVLVVPLLVVGTLGGMRVAASAQDARDLDALVGQVAAGQEVARFVDALQGERVFAEAYVALGRLIRAITPLGSVPALTLATALAGAATVALVAWLGRELGGRFLGISAAVVLGTTPFMWFYSATIATYAFDALGSVALMLLAWKARPGSWHGIAAAATLGLTGGFRQTSLIVLFPLALAAAARSSRTLRAWVACAVAGTAAVAVWFVPMVLEQPGGYHEISYNNRLFWDASAKRTSLFSGGLRRAFYDNLSQLTAHTVVTLGPVALVGAIAAVVLLLRRRDGADRVPPTPRSGWLTPVRLLLLAAVPPFAFCAIFHFGKAGYLLSFLPAAVLLLLLPVARLGVGRTRTIGAVAIAVVALFGSQRFLFGEGVLPDGLLERRPWFTHRVYGAPFTGTRHVIRQTDVQQHTFDEIFRRVASSRNISLETDSCENLRKLCLSDGRTELRACYPLDIINILTSIGRYEKKPITVTKDDIVRAASMYFAKA
jgi:hypothetical protein